MKLCFPSVLVVLLSGLQAIAGAPALQDAEIPGYRRALLDLAFDAASAMPVQPHLKNRSRSQKEVVDAWLELGQMQTAVDQIRKIGNWQKGMAYADLAYQCVSQAVTTEVDDFLEKAEGLAMLTEDWRRDRIRVRVAQTRHLLKTAPLLDGPPIDPNSPEQGKLLKGDSLEEKIAELRKIGKTGKFEEIRNALRVGAELFNTSYGDADKREALEAVIRTGMAPMPYFVRMELFQQMARTAARHGDAEKAVALVNDAQKTFDSATWKPEQYVRRQAELLAVRHQVGDCARAAAEAEALIEFYRKERTKIVNIFRGRALRPLAETLFITGRKDLALDMYKLALQEAVENPNSRPRAQDLCATACSLALTDVEPTPALWKQLKAVKNMLGDPW